MASSIKSPVIRGPPLPPRLRGSARNVMPNALTKHAAASALVSASSAPASGKFTRVSPATD